MSSLLNTHLHTPLHPLAVCFLSFYCSLTLSLPPSPFLLSATYWNTTQHSFAFSLPLLSFSPRHFSPASCLNCNSLHLTFQLPYTNKRTEHFGRAWRSAVGGKRAFVRLRRTAINHCFFFFFPAFFTQANSWRGGNLSLEQGTVPPRTHTHTCTIPFLFFSFFYSSAAHIWKWREIHEVCLGCGRDQLLCSARANWVDLSKIQVYSALHSFGIFL